ncbi:HlyD family type I secretion periplasmic adaptor subunit [Burkholderia cenocepacia]|uniref:Membrane fusion protein (MFP) family protein n=1 Tax=Burkholderia cenocepacia TaxID=95486 RepID=A0A3S9NES1_9BURK|nr:HlyD family type I secretion periplasmic adaptor subunit [Burkholderia cenocepacia]AZQ54091.1 HlyD family type I secretion periplasmic adaptor subunit [Burkholderia cenocepacia]
MKRFMSFHRLSEAVRRVWPESVISDANALPLPRRLIGISVAGVVAGMGLMWGWAALAPLSGAVVAEGAVRTEGERKTVQHLEGGIVKQILVRDGDRVKAGQVLIMLDNVVPAAELLALQAQSDAEQAKIARLSAERELKETLTFPAALENQRDDPRVAELLVRESSLFIARRRAFVDQSTMLRTELAQTRQEITISSQLIQTMNRSYDMARQQRRTNETLQQEGFVAETKVLDLQRTEADALSRVQSAAADLSRAKQRQTDLELRIAGLRHDYVKAADDELKDATARAIQIGERLRPARDQSARTRVTAPVAGVIVGLKVHTIGAVVAPREPIVDVVPESAPLIVEANIRPDDVREIAPGSHADVRLTAYNSRTTPMLDGKVAYISADALTDSDKRTHFYVVRVEVPAQALAKANRLAKEPVALGPGLRTEVYIRTHARSAFDYLLEPVRDGIRKSMRD